MSKEIDDSLDALDKATRKERKALVDLEAAKAAYVAADMAFSSAKRVTNILRDAAKEEVRLAFKTAEGDTP